MRDANIYAGAAIAGAIAGMRSMSSPAIVSQLAYGGLLPLGKSRLGFLANPAAGKTTFWLALGELVADKLPFVPRRTKVSPLIARGFSGALSGAAVTSAKKRNARLLRVPYIVVVGDREAADRKVAPWSREQNADLGAMPLDDFTARLLAEAAPPRLAQAAPGAPVAS